MTFVRRLRKWIATFRDTLMKIYLNRRLNFCYSDRIDRARLEIVAAGTRSVGPNTSCRSEHCEDRREQSRPTK